MRSRFDSMKQTFFVVFETTPPAKTLSPPPKKVKRYENTQSCQLMTRAKSAESPAKEKRENTSKNQYALGKSFSDGILFIYEKILFCTIHDLYVKLHRRNLA